MNLGTPARGLAFVRHVTTEETYRGGTIVIPPKARDKIAGQQFIVVAVGEPDYCDDEECCNRPHELPGDPPRPIHVYWVEPGDWVLCRNRMWESTPDPDIYYIKQSDIIGKFTEQAP